MSHRARPSLPALDHPELETDAPTRREGPQAVREQGIPACHPALRGWPRDSHPEARFEVVRLLRRRTDQDTRGVRPNCEGTRESRHTASGAVRRRDCVRASRVTMARMGEAIVKAWGPTAAPTRML